MECNYRKKNRRLLLNNVDNIIGIPMYNIKSRFI